MLRRRRGGGTHHCCRSSHRSDPPTPRRPPAGSWLPGDPGLPDGLAVVKRHPSGEVRGVAWQGAARRRSGLLDSDRKRPARSTNESGWRGAASEGALTPAKALTRRSPRRSRALAGLGSLGWPVAAESRAQREPGPGRAAGPGLAVTPGKLWTPQQVSAGAACCDRPSESSQARPGGPWQAHGSAVRITRSTSGRVGAPSGERFRTSGRPQLPSGERVPTISPRADTWNGHLRLLG